MTLNAQQAILKGKISDKQGEFLYGVNITIKSTQDKDTTTTGTITDFDGNYEIELPSGKYQVTYQFIGYRTITKRIEMEAGESKTINLTLNEKTEIIEEVVVSASKYEQKRSEVTVSMEVIKPQMIENTNTNRMDEAINKIPGVDVNDGQTSIRGGSGWSYGAGSRVLVLVDELPIISADGGNVKWNYLPVENISQVEVIKGASSVLYGSSAMNGVINLRTSYPTEKSKTKIIYNVGVYNQPKEPIKQLFGTTWDSRLYLRDNFPNTDEMEVKVPLRENVFYWVPNPMFSGLSFSHSRQYGNFDFVIAGNHYIDESYRPQNHTERTRINTNLRHRSEKIEGLAYGLDANFMGIYKADFLCWSKDEKETVLGNDSLIIYPYLPMEGTPSIHQGYRYNIDPFAYYYKKNGSRYSIRTRYYRTMNRIPNDSTKNNAADIFYGEYRYMTDINEKGKLAAGCVNSYSEIESNLFGEHYSNNLAGYLQYDHNFGRLKTSVGLRAEYYRVDSAQTESMIDIELGDELIEVPVKPVFRAGLNYSLLEYTHIRASFGQGYRFPSIAEKYTATAFAGILNIFPNPYLKPETGWNAEVGANQVFKLGENWTGFADLSLFWTRYNDMMEFSFAFVDTETYLPLADSVTPTFDNFGFQSQNIGDIRITGAEISISASGKIYKDLAATLFAGYTYLHPINLYNNEEERDKINSSKNRETDFLKYRYKHSLKGNIILDYKVFSIGMSVKYHSPILAMDDIFNSPDPEFIMDDFILGGYTDYWATHKYTPFVSYDCLFGWQMNEVIKSSIVIKNLFNRENMMRPGNMLAPRSMAFQLKAEF